MPNHWISLVEATAIRPGMLYNWLTRVGEINEVPADTQAVLWVASCPQPFTFGFRNSLVTPRQLLGYLALEGQEAALFAVASRPGYSDVLAETLAVTAAGVRRVSALRVPPNWRPAETRPAVPES